MNAQHTPGPWTEDDGAVYAEVNGATFGRRVADTFNQEENDYTYDEARANARLIAAAPELLDVLERLGHQVEQENQDAAISFELTELMREAFEVVRKARGIA